jgi:hypothetical protein
LISFLHPVYPVHPVKSTVGFLLVSILLVTLKEMPRPLVAAFHICQSLFC